MKLASSATRLCAFTLIELLVVISIIAILAALTLNVIPGVDHWKTRRGVEAQIQLLKTMIGNYKEERGYYPPSNAPSSPYPPSTNLLFYELVGTEEDNFGQFQAIARTNSIDANVVEQISGDRRRILNSSKYNTDVTANDKRASRYQLNPYDPDAGPDSESFHAEVKDKELGIARVPYAGVDYGVTLLVARARGPQGDFNPWSYRTPGVHNRESYDLWVDVQLGNKTVRIANWKE